MFYVPSRLLQTMRYETPEATPEKPSETENPMFVRTPVRSTRTLKTFKPFVYHPSIYHPSNKTTEIEQDRHWRVEIDRSFDVPESRLYLFGLEPNPLFEPQTLYANQTLCPVQRDEAGKIYLLVETKESVYDVEVLTEK